MSDDKRVVRGKMQIAGLMGPVWLIGWLFTVGFVDLSFVKSVLALLLWPYYLGWQLGA